MARFNNVVFDNSGITGMYEKTLVDIDPALGEEGVFRRLGLEYIEPEQRCADP